MHYFDKWKNMRDFTLHTYNRLLDAILVAGYSVQTFSEYLLNPKTKVVILRHDIDLKKRSSLLFARLENSRNIRASYYFRAVPKIYDPKIIKDVEALNHEIGYHYEDFSASHGNYEVAIDKFQKNLNRFRSIVDIKTICMHGRALSKFDNRCLWNKYNYKEYGIIGEPYIDLDFDKVLYLTDSAQRWDGSKIEVRDKVSTNYSYNFRTTFDIIESINTLPEQVMITVHPDRWTNNILEWHRINSTVKLKNIIKKYILSKKAQKYIVS